MEQKYLGLTFGQYSIYGVGVPASANRASNDPVAPNFSPVSGTVRMGLGHILSSLENLGLDRFGAGVVVDICLERVSSPDLLAEILTKFIEKKGSILTITIAGEKELRTMYEICKEVREGKKDPHELDKYNQVFVRVGGFNAPFITLPETQQEDYMKRVISASSQ